MLTQIKDLSGNFTVKIALGFLLIFAMAQIQIPLKPVPITLQSIAAMLLGFAYRPKEAAITWATYLVAGFAGLPVFFNFTYGIAKLYGPTSGYLFGMALSSILISHFKDKFLKDKRDIFKIASLIIFGHFIIFSLGVAVLASQIGFYNAIYSGFIILIPSGIIKTAILSVLLRLIYEKF